MCENKLESNGPVNKTSNNSCRVDMFVRRMGEVLIYNRIHKRNANQEEIDKLIRDCGLFINSYIIGKQVGEVFVDIIPPWDKEFKVRYFE